MLSLTVERESRDSVELQRSDGGSVGLHVVRILGIIPEKIVKIIFDIGLVMKRTYLYMAVCCNI